uniref:CUB domain-containing protein n=1 Tax=Bracon brevicornis TaxID=1563983 RepID=A0A6V7LEZ1_9HYME
MTDVAQAIVYLLLVATLENVGIAAKSSMYVERHLVDAEICHPLGKSKTKIRLPSAPNSGLIISPSYKFDHWDNILQDLKCKFTVIAPKGEHLLAVIQTLSLRRNGSECLDYVMFKTEENGYSEKFCGFMDRKKIQTLAYSEDTKNWLMKNKTFGYGEFEPRGDIETTIFVSKQPGENLNVTIVYTPYKDCEKVNPLEYRTTRHKVCIWRDYFCDGIVNCLANICDDEGSCPDQAANKVTGTKVTIGAVTTIFAVFFFFIMALWLCKKYKMLCWSRDCAGPAPQDPRIRNDGVANNPSAAVSSMLEISVLASAQDKDLPPSYDSLFPEPEPEPQPSHSAT